MNTPKLRMEHYSEELTSLQIDLSKLSLEEMMLDHRKSEVVRKRDLTLAAIKSNMQWMSDEATFIAEQKAANKKSKKKVAKKATKPAKKQAKKTVKKTTRKRK